MTGNIKNEDFWYDRAMYWCSRREMCCSEIKARLLKAEVNEDVITNILKKLISEKFIDENRFARAFVHDKLEFQKWGLLKIKQALYLKGISEEDIKEALQGIDKESYLTKLEEISRNKLRSIKAESDYERSQKLLRFLASKGVSTDDAYQILKRSKLEE
ncbi:MAG: regulatory protein RecX [Bacteroidales bacterium]|nr:regulatory protein RecX [Bacteroidales bacterium]